MNATLARVRESNKIVLHDSDNETTEFIRQGTRWQAWDLVHNSKDRFAAGMYSDNQLCFTIEDTVSLGGLVRFKQV
jgi:hypothetical protein